MIALVSSELYTIMLIFNMDKYGRSTKANREIGILKISPYKNTIPTNNMSYYEGKVVGSIVGI